MLTRVTWMWRTASQVKLEVYRIMLVSIAIVVDILHDSTCLMHPKRNRLIHANEQGLSCWLDVGH
jgi:hypothetical protein